jgi:hypothetical protein
MTSAAPDPSRDADSNGPRRTSIGPLTVSADMAEARRFAKATAGQDESADELPFTFPLRWLATPAVRAVIAQLVTRNGETAFLPLHESQTFDYAAVLRPDTDYRMIVDIHRDPENPQIVLHAEIGPDETRIHLRMDMVLRLVPVDAKMAGAAEPARHTGL